MQEGVIFVVVKRMIQTVYPANVNRKFHILKMVIEKELSFFLLKSFILVITVLFEKVQLMIKATQDYY